MKQRSAVARIAVLAATACLAACGGTSLPRTPANVALCTMLARTLDNRSSAQELAGLTLESNAPVSHQLRQDVATYIGFAAGSPPDPASAQQAAATAEKDCGSIHAPVATSSGGSG